MPKRKVAAKRRYVTYEREDDIMCVVLAECCRTSKSIAKILNLTESQVAYRISKAGLVGQRLEFRRGNTATSRMFAKWATPQLVKQHQPLLVRKFRRE